MSDKLTELLTSVYQSVISDENSWHKPRTISCLKFKENGVDKKIEREYTNCKEYEFDISSSDMQFKFNVRISKMEEFGLFGKDKSRYVTSIEIFKKPSNYQYSSSSIEVFWFISWKDNSTPIQKKIFDYLEQNHIMKSKKDKDEKYETYIGDLKKTITKSGLRDDKLDELLSES